MEKTRSLLVIIIKNKRLERSFAMNEEIFNEIAKRYDNEERRHLAVSY